MVALGLIVLTAPAQAGTFANTGTFMGRVVNLAAGILLNSGSIIGREKVNITCDELKGEGLIKSPIIYIAAKVFNFTGTIECEQECTIKTGTLLEQLKFTKAGSGKFTYVPFEDPIQEGPLPGSQN